MAITPIQFVVSSAITQKSSLATSNASAPAPDVANAATSNDSVAAVPDVSNKLIAASNLYNASVNLAGNSSQLATANLGTQQIAQILRNLQSVATQISNNGGPSVSLAQLEAEFQSLYAQIDQIANETSFNNSSLLDGTFSLDSNSLGLDAGSDGSSSVSVPDLSTKSLFSTPPNVNTAQGAASAITAIGAALDTVDGVNSNIENVSNQLSFVVASVATAQANVYASSSTLTESDLSNAGLTGFISGLLSKPSSSANAQTGKLSDKLLNLIGGDS